MIGPMFKDHMIQYKESRTPPQIAIMVASKLPDLDKLEPAFYQSWNFKSACEVVGRKAKEIFLEV